MLQLSGVGVKQNTFYWARKASVSEALGREIVRVIDKIQLTVPPLLPMSDVSLKYLLTMPAHKGVVRAE